MKILTFILVSSVLLFTGCKSECNNCTKLSNEKAQQIESQDHYVPWWAKSK